jgi:DNA polymerase/3'-5' exonuclease PolX
VASGIPVDFFAATLPTWATLLVCRTGSAEMNTRICMAAQAKRWKWSPYRGFETPGGLIRPESEQHLFSLVGLPYLEPWQR